MSDAVKSSQTGGVLEIVLDRAPANALGEPLLQGLASAVDAFLEGDARAVVLSSAVPGFFAAGADIKQMATTSAVEFAEYRDALRAPLERLAGCGRPSIAAIDGLALGGGLELAMACTLRFASAASSLGLPEVNLGLIPGAGGTQRLPRLVGRGRALEIMLSARQVGAEEAARIGLVDRIADDAREEALTFARRLARCSETAVRAIIECVDAEAGPHADGMQVEGDAVLRTFAEGEAREGITAFIERREPIFA